MGHRLDRAEVIHGNDLNIGSLSLNRSEKVTTNTAKSINTNSHSHGDPFDIRRSLITSVQETTKT
jgi:hypothetical protein